MRVVCVEEIGPGKRVRPRKIDDRNGFVAAKFLFSSKWVMKVNILTGNFTILANCPMQNYFSCQLTPKAQKESQHSSQMKKFTTLSEANNKMVIR